MRPDPWSPVDSSYPVVGHVRPRFAVNRIPPFATQTIPATVHEAPYILDGLLMNETGRRVREQYADTGGFTHHVFAACSILGYAFVPTSAIHHLPHHPASRPSTPPPGPASRRWTTRTPSSASWSRTPRPRSVRRVDGRWVERRAS